MCRLPLFVVWVFETRDYAARVRTALGAPATGGDELHDHGRSRGRRACTAGAQERLLLWCTNPQHERRVFHGSSRERFTWQVHGGRFATVRGSARDRRPVGPVCCCGVFCCGVFCCGAPVERARRGSCRAEFADEPRKTRAEGARRELTHRAAAASTSTPSPSRRHCVTCCGYLSQ